MAGHLYNFPHWEGRGGLEEGVEGGGEDRGEAGAADLLVSSTHPPFLLNLNISTHPPNLLNLSISTG